MPSEQVQSVEITQADRDAAAAFYGPHLSRPGEVLVTAHMRAGKIDESPLIQAFARHRTRALLEAIKPVEIIREWFGGERYARDYEYLDANFGKQAKHVADFLNLRLRLTAGQAMGESK